MGAEIQITSVNILAIGTTSLSYFFPSSLHKMSVCFSYFVLVRF